MRRKLPHSRPSRHHRLLLLSAGLLLLLGSAPLRADDQPKRILLLTTSSLRATRFAIWLTPGFFPDNSIGLKSDAILNPLFVFRGNPLKTQPGTPSLGSADTVIEVPENLGLQGNTPETKLVGTKVLALDLVSTVPLTVTYNGGSPEQWNVRLCLSVVPQPDSVMTITNDCKTNGGTFTANLSVRPKLILTRVSDGMKRTTDAGCAGFYAMVSSGFWTDRSATAGELLSVPAGSTIDRDCDDFYDTTLPATSNLIPGLARVGCSWSLPQQGYLALRPITQDMYDSQTVLPTPATAGALPFPLDNRAPSPLCPDLSDRP